MNKRILAVGSEKVDSVRPKRKPRIRISGFWLNEYGFERDSLVIAEYDQERITFKLQGSGMEAYKAVVKQVRESDSLALLQVKAEMHNGKRTPHIEVKGPWLEDLGFSIGSWFVLRPEYGVFTLRLLDLDRLGY
ncbi:MAG: hypothetical protein ACM3QZ_08105 [Solirubrobacterales bacterium]